MKDLQGFKNDLEKIIKNSDQVFIIPHIGVDLDAISSCIAMSYIVRKLGKSSYIVIDEDSLKIEPGVKMIMEECVNNMSIVTLDKYKKISSNNDSLILCDVNKKHLICLKNELSSFKSIAIIDHHNMDSNTIETNYKFINEEKSSASEMMYDLLKLFQIKPDSFLANYLLAGIYLDTNKFTKNAGCSTMRVVANLTARGADIAKVNRYFEEDFYSDRRVQNLIDRCDFYSYTIALCVGDKSARYQKEELAKVADYLLKYRTVDASFAVGYTEDDIISISARSKGEVNVGEIMSGLDGGGHTLSAATRLEGADLDDTVKKLKKLYKSRFSIK